MAKKRGGRHKPLRWGWIFAAAVLLSAMALEKLGLSWEELPGMTQVTQAVEELYGYGDSAPEPLLPDRDAKRDEFELHMIDVGQALSILMVSPEGNTALIDAGESGDGETVVDYLHQEGIEKLDYLIATHAHADHIGGMREVVENMEIGTIIMSEIPEAITPTSKAYTGLLEAIALKGYRITPAKPGEKFPLGEATLTVLGPTREYDDLNDTSVVTRTTYGDISFLVEGDAEETAEEDMLAGKLPLSGEVLIAGHHGSATSSSFGYLNAVSPLYIGISCGVGNSYGHPHQEALERMDEVGAEVYRTDLDGTVVFSTDGKDIRVKTENT